MVMMLSETELVQKRPLFLPEGPPTLLRTAVCWLFLVVAHSG